MNFPMLSEKKAIKLTLVFAVIFIGFALVRESKNDIVVRKSGEVRATISASPTFPRGALSGLECERGNVRPIGVMYASDPETRPLSGIGSADIVIEMPVTEGGVTRMMALFQCHEPKEYGSIRSARLDFIPLVKSFDAILVHWGGEHEALAQLDAGVLDNIDCLKLDGTTCRRKSNRPRPHNGFSVPALLAEKIDQLGYRTDADVTQNTFTESSNSEGVLAPSTLYAGDFAIRWTYDPAINRYSRFRAGSVELDRLTGLQVQADNVIVMSTTSRYVSVLYNRVQTTGSGTATFYKNGVIVSGTWEKPTDTSRLVFKDQQGKEIAWNPGATWIEIVAL